MFVRALIAFLVLPGAFAFLLPPVIATFDSWRGEMWPEGYPFQVLGALIILLCVREFYVTGKGTLAPWCPPKHLVVIGPYRYVRNPVYIGVVLLVSGLGFGHAFSRCGRLYSPSRDRVSYQGRFK